MPNRQFDLPDVCQLRLPIFEGEIDTLVRLVADRKLGANEIRMADVASQVSDYLAGQRNIDLEQVGDLVASVARLLLLKSSRLLARPDTAEEVEDDRPVASPVDRTELVRAATDLRVREGWDSVAPVSPGFAFEQRTEPREPSVLAHAWLDMRQRHGREPAPVVLPTFVRLEVALSGLVRRLKSSATLSLSSLLHGTSRNDVVIYFLAVLELARRRQVLPRQSELFGDISLEYVDRSAEAATRAG